VDPAKIPDAVLSGNRVVKANHGSGWNHFVLNGDLDRKRMEDDARSWMSQRYGRPNKEWAYERIVPELFVEEMIMTGGLPVNMEYKCYVAMGEFVYAYAKVDRLGPNPRDVVFDENGRSLIARIDQGTVTVRLPKPAHWDRIVHAARNLGRDFDMVRCDLYEANGVIYFSEFTFYSAAGYSWVDSPALMSRLNSMWDIRRSWFLTTSHRGWRRFYARLLSAALDAARNRTDCFEGL
jgi:hypothetical protein